MGKSLLARRRWGVAAPSTVTSTASLVASSAAVAIRLAGGQGLVLLSTTPSADCFIRFGLSDVTAATSADWPLFAGTEYLWAVGNDTTHYRVIRASADGLLNSFVVMGA